MGLRNSGMSVARGVGLGLVLLVALPFVFHSVRRGLSPGSAAEQLGSRFVSSDSLATGAIYGHMVLGGVLTALVLFQLLHVIRKRWPRLHHANGYLVGALSAATGVLGLIYIARQGTIGGPLMSAGFGLYGCLLILSAAQTLRFARLGDPRHAAWAGRLIILALASWFFRVQYGLWDVAFGDLARTDTFTGAFDRAMFVGFYLPWLGLYEVIRAVRGNPDPV